MPKAIKIQPNLTYGFRVEGGRRFGVRDAAHALFRMAWWRVLLVVFAMYLVLNALFAAAYVATGGVANAAPGSFADAFFFSVQTMATIGYGAMYPQSTAAHVVVVVESMVGIVVSALATGLVFVRFSQIRGRVTFSNKVAISVLNGQPTVMVRVGNERSNSIFNAEFRLALVRTIRTQEGVAMYRTVDLKLVRDRAATLNQSWNLLHTIDEESPFFNETPESLTAAEAELNVSITGVDDTSLQPVYGRKTWEAHDFAWGARLGDVLTEEPDGTVVLNLNHFHTLTPVPPTPNFPYEFKPDR